MRKTAKDKALCFRLPDTLPESTLSAHVHHEWWYRRGSLSSAPSHLLPGFGLPGSPPSTVNLYGTLWEVSHWALKREEQCFHFLPELCHLHKVYYLFPHSTFFELWLGLWWRTGRVGGYTFSELSLFTNPWWKDDGLSRPGTWGLFILDFES